MDVTTLPPLCHFVVPNSGMQNSDPEPYLIPVVLFCFLRLHGYIFVIL